VKYNPNLGYIVHILYIDCTLYTPWPHCSSLVQHLFTWQSTGEWLACVLLPMKTPQWTDHHLNVTHRMTLSDSNTTSHVTLNIRNITGGSSIVSRLLGQNSPPSGISQHHHFHFRPWGFPSVIIMEFPTLGEFWPRSLETILLANTERKYQMFSRPNYSSRNRIYITANITLTTRKHS